MTVASQRAADPAAIEAAAGSLREAGARLKERDRREALEVLGDWIERWRAPDSPWQDELAVALAKATDQHEPTVRHGLRLALETWKRESLVAAVDRELGAFPASGVEGFGLSGTVLAGSIPMPTLLAVLWPLALQSPVLVKSAARDPVTARLAARTLGEIDPLLGQCVAVLDFGRDAESCHRAFAGAVDCLVATGSDGAVATWASLCAPPRRFVGFGHRLSVVALGPEADLEREARAIALDTALWDQQGCLSPAAVYTVGADAGARARALAGHLAPALAEAERSWPRAEVPPAAAALAAHERAEAEMRAAAGRAVHLEADGQARWSVVAEEDATPRPAPLHRFVRIHPTADARAWARAVRPFASSLAGVALAGFGAETPGVVHAAGSLGASRVCAPGQLQRPPLDWHHDGQPLLLPLARIVDREIH